MAVATIKDIARIAGVAPSVVSRALNNKYGVKESTRQRIIQIARELGYYPNSAARSLVTRRSETIGIVMADISEPFYSQSIKGMEYVAKQTGYTLLFSNSYENVEQGQVLHKMISGERVDGLVIVGSNIQEKSFISLLLERDIPFVLVERKFSDPRVNCIWLDNVKGGYMATKYLIEKGHRRIGHIAGNLYFQVALDRIEGYKRALAEAGIDFSQEWVAAGDFLTHGGYRAMKELLPLGCTAVFVANDAMAYGALRAISEAGLKVPDDIAIVGFDDLEFSSLTNPPLTTIRQPRYEMGRKSLEILTSILRERRSGDEASPDGVKVCFQPELIVRQSA